MTLVRLGGQAQRLSSVKQSRAVALGLGGAGNHLLTHLMELDLGLSCIAVDTDRYDLQIAKAHSKFLIQHATEAGTQGDIEVGKELGQKAIRELQPILGAEIVFVLAGMGGGTGGGTGPIFAANARQNGALVIGLVTRPFQFERGRFHPAIDSIRRMVDACDTVILIDNHTFEHSSMTLPFGLSMDAAEQTCCSIVQALGHAFSSSGLCNAELGELRTMLRRGGLAKVHVGHSHSQLGAEEASLRALRSTMAHGDLSVADGVFVNIAGGNHVQPEHVESAMQLLSRSINPSAQFLYGHRVDANMLGTTRATLLATGVSFPFSWGKYRRIPLELYDLEPESAQEQGLGLRLELQQLESYAN